MSINSVNISGNLTRDPEVRQSGSGMNVMKFSVAVNNRRKNASTGEWEDHPAFVNCTLFGNRCDYVSKNISRGSKVYINGKLSQSEWTDKQSGEKRVRLEVLVDEIDFDTKGSKGVGAASGGAADQDYYSSDCPF